MEIFKKIYKIINSCETEEQLEIANKYLDTALKNKYIEWEFYRAIYIDIYLRKKRELLHLPGWRNW